MDRQRINPSYNVRIEPTHKKLNHIVWLEKKLPLEVDIINYCAVSWCEEMLDKPTEADIQWTENYIVEMLTHFGKETSVKQSNS